MGRVFNNARFVRQTEKLGNYPRLIIHIKQHRPFVPSRNTGCLLNCWIDTRVCAPLVIDIEACTLITRKSIIHAHLKQYYALVGCKYEVDKPEAN